MITLGSKFEAAMIAAAGLDGLNIEPGSLRIDTIMSPQTTVRFTVVAVVDGDVVRSAATTDLAG